MSFWPFSADVVAVSGGEIIQRNVVIFMAASFGWHCGNGVIQGARARLFSAMFQAVECVGKEIDC